MISTLAKFLFKNKQNFRLFTMFAAVSIFALGVLGTIMPVQSQTMSGEINMSTCPFAAYHGIENDATPKTGNNTDVAEHLEAWRAAFLVSIENGLNLLFGVFLAVVLFFTCRISAVSFPPFLGLDSYVSNTREGLCIYLSKRKFFAWLSSLRQAVDLRCIAGCPV